MLGIGSRHQPVLGFLAGHLPQLLAATCCSLELSLNKELDRHVAPSDLEYPSTPLIFRLFFSGQPHRSWIVASWRTAHNSAIRVTYRVMTDWRVHIALSSIGTAALFTSNHSHTILPCTAPPTLACP